MIANYLKVAYRNLVRHRLFTLINVTGLSIGLACCILIFLFVQQEHSFDRFHKNGNSLYRVLTVSRQSSGEIRVGAYEPMPLAPALKAEFPGILHAARFSSGGVIIANGDKAFTERVMYADPEVFAMFDIKFVEGNPVEALRQPNDIVITTSMAQKYFGTDQAYGRHLSIRARGQTELYAVVGVIEPMPPTSSLRFEFLVNIVKHSMYERLHDRWTFSNGSTFVQLDNGVSGQELATRFPGFVDRHFAPDIQSRRATGGLSRSADAFRLELQPIADIHLDSRVSSSPEELGNPTYAWILSGIGVLVLAIACINFVTLTIGRSANRAREVGVRKVFGALRNQLINQFWGEALILCVIALIVGLVLAELLLPGVNSLFGKRLSLDLFSNPGLLAGILGLFLLVGILAGAYPALLLSRFEPVNALKGKFRMGGQSVFTKILVIVQFGLSIFLVCMAIVLSDQIRFLVTTNLGFRAEQVVVVPLPGGDTPSTERLAGRFRARLEQNRGVVSTSLTSGAFTQGYDISGFQYNGQQKSTYVYRVDEQYLATLGIPLKYGRNFVNGSAADRDGAMIVNEAFLRSMGWPEPALGRRLEGTDDERLAQLRIIGVVKDFHFASLEEEIAPLVLFADTAWSLNAMLIRIAPDNIPSTFEYLHATWMEVAPGTPFDATFLDEDFQRLYDREMRWSRIVSAASGLAISLACLGLLGLATLAVTNRTKEIGIRRVLGATGSSIARLLSKEFLTLVAIANIIAWPASFVAATEYLNGYAYRISLSPWIFLGAGGVTLIIALATIAGYIAKAVRANPVETLRYE